MHYSNIRESYKNDEIKELKKELNKSLDNFRKFVSNSNIKGIEYEVESIEKFYKAKLFDLFMAER